ncbi:hypothetical protein NSTC745_04172 [Nostoc sp. DSM 114161]|jgi:hypothetical protein
MSRITISNLSATTDDENFIQEIQEEDNDKIFGGGLITIIIKIIIKKLV